jgi:ribosome maturation factor RimP
MMQCSNQQTAQQHLIDRIGSLIKPIGYELVYAEVQTHKQRLLRLFIDHLPENENKSVNVEDCVKVTRAVDEPLDQDPELAETVGKLFGSAPYELEVSSPGVDRPLRLAKDFIRFAGREIRVHVFRPLTSAELDNAEYQARNPKQKNYLGTLLGLDMKNENVRLKVNPAGGLDAEGRIEKKKKKAKSSVNQNTNTSGEARDDSGLIVSIPLPLISKSHLEPRFDFEA